MSMTSEGWTIIRADEGQDAAELLERLLEAGVDAELCVCVKAEQTEDARRVLDGSEGDADPSADLDLETIAVFQGADAEMQAVTVQGLLEQGGISVVVEGAHGLPSLPFEVKVAKRLLVPAREILARAEADGPAAADAEAGGN